MRKLVFFSVAVTLLVIVQVVGLPLIVKAQEPCFKVHVVPDLFWVGNFLPNSTLTVTINPGGFTTTATTDGAGGCHFTVDHDVKAGDVVTMTDGLSTSTHTVTNVTVDCVDIVNDTLSGTANPGTTVKVVDWESGIIPEQNVAADGLGNWIVNYSAIGFDLQPGHHGAAVQRDDYYNYTAFDWPTDASLEILDPNPDMLVEHGDNVRLIDVNDAERDWLAVGGTTRVGAVTDGVTKLLLRLKTYSDNPVEFSLSPEWGKLTELNGSDSSWNITVSPVELTDGYYAFAVYQVPDHFPGNPSDIEQGVEASISVCAAGMVSREIPIKLIPPPVILVHGLWSDKTVWEEPNGGLLGYLKGAGFHVFYIDYGLDQPAASFDPWRNGDSPMQRLANETRFVLDWLRNERLIAVSQVDVVAHSMGGLVARSHVASQWNPYEKLTNFKKGDFNKIITIGTPHDGTPFADWLLEHKCYKPAAFFSIWGPTLEETLAMIGKPIGPGIYEMQTESKVLENLGETKVPSHAISCSAPIYPLTEATLLNLMRMYTADVFTTIDDLLGGDGNHDTIVPVTSQRGGLVHPEWNHQSDIVHADIFAAAVEGGSPDIGETESTDVWEDVKTYLLKPPDSSDFGENFPEFNRPGEHEPIRLKDCTTTTAPYSSFSTKEESSEASSSATVTLMPQPGTLVLPGELLDINFTIENGNLVDGAFFILGDRLHTIEGGGPFSFSYEVPSCRGGVINIYAFTFGPGPENFMASTWIAVQPDSILISLEALPQNISMDQTGQFSQIRVIGHYSDGTNIDLTASEAGTSYSVLSGTDTIISVSPNGLVESQGPGEDSVLISNSGQLTQVVVDVTITNLPPVLDPLADVTIKDGETLDLTLTATDPDGNEIRLTGFNLPSFAAVVDLGGGSGQLQLHPLTTDIGIYSFAVVATDNGLPPYGDVKPIEVRVVLSDCEGDFEPDGDVDGTDLVQEINAGGSNIDQFAADFGRTDCP